MTQSILSSLMCEEALDASLLQKTPEHCTEKPEFDIPNYENPIVVKSTQDIKQIKDVRILQNLLRNEERFLPTPDFLANQPMITPQMRQIVANWLLDIVQDGNNTSEVFCLAMNIMDRFLCTTKIHTTMYQLLGAVCLLIASKTREPLPIPGQTLIKNSDYSITAEEIKVSSVLTFVTSIEDF